ncbi:putative phosphatidic acid phosphatase type 2 domain containing 1B [Operophtera brumata]|uniref:Putative phosphatidic acid phosphatase type 2 domain containing 1B n=1 Tax=Operophtera brumata TaxID=104452 RepID=A0A0L7L150_OPEBR|nr:putative phosphatidic acid phosphatase type 2 domain containing 1B [Operophtera brumata]
MWRGVQIMLYNSISEILVRIVLLITVCIMHVCIEPHARYITELDLLHYKRPRRESFIPPWAMIFLIVCVPLVILSIPSLTTGGYKDMIQSLLAWTLACAINAFITESGKLIIGRPRPDFFYRCYPNGKITKDLQCSGINKDVIDGRKSFPSGHSSFSFCSLGFVSIWLCGKLRVLSRNRGDGLRVLTCLVPLVVAGVVSMSRCCDNHHHWEDVFTGAIIGFTSSYFCYRQYYYPLDSEQSGSPYLSTGEHKYSTIVI